MRALATTTRSILWVDTDQRVVKVVHRGMGIYFGIAVDREGFVVAARDCDGALGKAADERGKLLYFTPEGALANVAEPPFPLRDLHGLLAHDGATWATCSRDNMVAIHDPRSGDWRAWYPAPDPDARGEDIHHFNSLAMKKGRLFALAHNRGPSEIWEFTYPGRTLVRQVPLGEHAHDIWFAGHSILTCNSHRGRIESTSGRCVRIGEFPRGIARARRETLVGVSQYGPRERRHQSTAIARLFTAHWRRRSTLAMPGEGMFLAACPWPEAYPDLEKARALPCLEEASWSDHDTEFAHDRYDLHGAIGDIHAAEGEWRSEPGGLRWTTARQARVHVVVNPDDQWARIEGESRCPIPLRVEVSLGGAPIGSAWLAAPGPFEIVATLPPGRRGLNELGVGVNRLWRPLDWLKGETDASPRGVGVRRIEFRRGPAKPQGLRPLEDPPRLAG